MKRKFEGESTVRWTLYGIAAFIVLWVYVDVRAGAAVLVAILSPIFVEIFVLAWQRLEIMRKDGEFRRGRFNGD